MIALFVFFLPLLKHLCAEKGKSDFLTFFLTFYYYADIKQ